WCCRWQRPSRSFPSRARLALLLVLLCFMMLSGTKCPLQHRSRCKHETHCHLFRLDLKDGEEGLLRNFHAAHLLHAFLARLLLLEELAPARDVAPVALGQHVLAQ